METIRAEARNYYCIKKEIWVLENAKKKKKRKNSHKQKALRKPHKTCFFLMLSIEEKTPKTREKNKSS